MLVEVKVPQLSESVAEATLVSWHKKVGEFVKRDENLVDIETDKVVLEVVAPEKGTIEKLIKNTGDTVLAQEVIAIFTPLKEGAKVPSGIFGRFMLPFKFLGSTKWPMFNLK